MTAYGKLGVKVWICRGEVLPGEMVKEPEKPKMGNRPSRPRRPRNNEEAPVKAEEVKAEVAPQVKEDGE